MFIHKKKKGQSTVEYVLLVAGVIAVAIAFTTNPGGGLQQKLTDTVTTATDGMDTVSRFEASHTTADVPANVPAGSAVNPTPQGGGAVRPAIPGLVDVTGGNFIAPAQGGGAAGGNAQQAAAQ